MTKQLLIGQLRAGSTGNEILDILDMIVGEVEDTNIQDCAEHITHLPILDQTIPTLEEIPF